jgi:DNA-directed RNA polymerase specialized sigma24 family protein
MARRELCRLALNALPATQREALRLCFLGGLLQREAGVRMRCSEDAARHRVDKGLRAARGVLEGLR